MAKKKTAKKVTAKPAVKRLGTDVIEQILIDNSKVISVRSSSTGAMVSKIVFDMPKIEAVIYDAATKAAEEKAAEEKAAEDATTKAAQ